MENVHKEIARVLLGRLCARGLISEAAYSEGVELIHAATEFPELLQYPAVERGGEELWIY